MSKESGSDIDSIRLGPVWLAPGISKLNAWTFLFAAFAGIALNSFVSIIMPYILNVNIGLPTGDQGRVAGDLVFYGELVLISLSGFLGAWSDQYGRRIVLVVGMLLLGMGYVALGYASSVSQLIAIRMFATIGIAAVTVMITTNPGGLPARRITGQDGGPLPAWRSVSVPSLIGVLFTRLPDWYTGVGYEPLEGEPPDHAHDDGLLRGDCANPAGRAGWWPAAAGACKSSRSSCCWRRAFRPRASIRSWRSRMAVRLLAVRTWLWSALSIPCG